MEIQTILLISIILIIILLFQFFKPLIKLFTDKLDISEFAVPFKETKYFNDYYDKFKNICTKAEIDFDKLNIFLLPVSSDADINAVAWETVRDRNNIIITERTLEIFEHDPEMVEVMFAHELGHLNYMDSLLMTIKSEYLPALIPLCMLIAVFGIAYAGDIFLVNISSAWETVIGILYIVILFFLIFTTLIIMLTSSIIPVWVAQLAEIRADLFSKKLCGIDAVLRFLQLMQEYEDNYFSSLVFGNRLFFVYNRKQNAHPNMLFRAEQIKKFDEIGFSYRLAHYFRLLWWLMTFRGFYGRNVIFLKKIPFSTDI